MQRALTKKLLKLGRVQNLPDYKKGFSHLSDSFPSLGKSAPTHFVLKKHRKLLLFCPRKSPTSPKLKYLYDFCRKFGISEFIGSQPQFNSPVRADFDPKTKESKLIFAPNYFPTTSEWRQIEVDFKKWLTAHNREIRTIKPISKTAILKHLVGQEYMNLIEKIGRKDRSKEIPKIHKLLAKRFKTTPQVIKNLLSR